MADITEDRRTKILAWLQNYYVVAKGEGTRFAEVSEEAIRAANQSSHPLGTLTCLT